MGHAALHYRPHSMDQDILEGRYHFPSKHLPIMRQCIGDWIIFYETTKVINTRGYFAVAKIQDIDPDRENARMRWALIEPGTYMELPKPVPFSGPIGNAELDVFNQRGGTSGLPGVTVRELPESDFLRIVNMSLDIVKTTLPRLRGDDLFTSSPDVSSVSFQEEDQPFEYEERDRYEFLTSRASRERAFRHVVLRAYDQRCAVTGWQFINGGGRAEVEAAHIRPVEFNGPDTLRNGLALSGTVHWMFDRGLISLADDLKILISRQVNDPDSVRSLVNESGYALVPKQERAQPRPDFLKWHRENCFKQ